MTLNGAQPVPQAVTAEELNTLVSDTIRNVVTDLAGVIERLPASGAQAETAAAHLEVLAGELTDAAEMLRQQAAEPGPA